MSQRQDRIIVGGLSCDISHLLPHPAPVSLGLMVVRPHNEQCGLFRGLWRKREARSTFLKGAAERHREGLRVLGCSHVPLTLRFGAPTCKREHRSAPGTCSWTHVTPAKPVGPMTGTRVLSVPGKPTKGAWGSEAGVLTGVLAIKDSGSEAIQHKQQCPHLHKINTSLKILIYQYFN